MNNVPILGTLVNINNYLYMTYSIYTPEMLAFKDWLKKERIKRKLSMRELAARLDKPHSFVQKVEQGERRLDVVEFIWYCRALQTNPIDGLSVLMMLEEK